MNIGRLVLSIIVVVIATFAFDTLFHAVGLGAQYEATAESWRPEEEMSAWVAWHFICYILIAIGFCTIWAVGFAPHGHGLKCGLIYGFFAGLIGNGSVLLMFVFIPIPTQFLVPWAIGGVLGALIAGALVALVYKPKAGAAPNS